ncbi:MAG: NUDIX domain-containing protein [Candidatus Berkelbacteria bacterium]
MNKKDSKIQFGLTFVLLREDSKILMQLRDDGNGKNILYPNMWTIPGGGQDAGESDVEGIVREIKEELDLEVLLSECEFIFEFMHDENVRDRVFLCRVKQDVKVELHEGAAIEWMTLADIKKLKLAFHSEEIIPTLEKILNK